MIGGLSKFNRYLLAGAGAIGMLAVGGMSAKAADVAQLEAQMRAMQAQMSALQKEVQEAKAAAANSGGGDLDLNVKWKGAPELSSKDGKFKFKVRGRLQTDYNHVNQDTPITTYPDVSATEIRRARLGVEGVMFYDWYYIVEVDFANNATVIKDAYMQYQGWKIGDTPVRMRVGNFKTPNTFEDLTSDNYVDTMERANFINAWGIDPETIGAQISYWTPHWGLAAGIFGEDPGSGNKPLVTGFFGDQNLTFAARGSVAPINRDVNGVKQVLFFGASVRTRDTGDDQPFLAYNAKGADFHLTNNALATGNIGDSDTFWGLEGAGLWGPFAIQGEYGHTNVDLPNGTTIRSSSGQGTANPFINVPNPEYSAWYIEGSWFFGGHKTYEDLGAWGRPVVDHPMFHGSGGWGALQIVGKYDVIDQSDTGNQSVSKGFVGACATTALFPSSNPAEQAALCGDMKTWIVGVNWYPNDHVRLMFDYAQSDLSNYPLTTVETGAPTQKAGFDNATIRGFGMRAQIDW